MDKIAWKVVMYPMNPWGLSKRNISFYKVEENKPNIQGIIIFERHFHAYR